MKAHSFEFVRAKTLREAFDAFAAIAKSPGLEVDGSIEIAEKIV
jgi:hypothetical protein